MRQISAHAPCAETASLMAAVRAAFAEHDLPVRGEGAQIECDTGIGRLGISADGTNVALTIHAETEGNIHMLREAAIAYLDPLLGEGALIWSDAGSRPANALPPNFRIMEAERAWPVAPGFVRIRLRGENLAPFTQSGMHFRLAIPRPDRTPVWPVVGKSGKTEWPRGEDELHTPAYTIVAIDAGAGWLDFDVYTHGRGPTCAWAEAMVAGHGAQRVVGLSGPGGGWIPQARHLVLAGDETALPAILRILREVGDDVTADAVIEVVSPEARQDVPIRPGHALRWVFRSDGGRAADAVRAMAPAVAQESFAWFAGEKADVEALRRLFRQDWGVPKERTYVAAYWSDRIT